MKRTLIALGVAVFSLAAALAAPPEPNEQDKLLAKMPLFTKDDPWHRDVSKDPVDPNSDAIIAQIGGKKNLHPDFGAKYGIPFQFVDAKTPKINPKFQYADESDRVPYPVPAKPLIEGVDSPDNATVDGDRHILCIDKETWKLYELYHCYRKGEAWTCGSGAVWDLTKLSAGQRPKGWTSADAAGLAIFPGLVRYDEVAIKKEIDHAIRFTVKNTRKAFVFPATHHAGKNNDPLLLPMGARMRLKADVDISKFPEECQVILRALKKHGMILADNGSDFFITGAPDSRWNDDNINQLKKIKGSDFEVIKIGPLN